jgi:hypothetical protein
LGLTPVILVTQEDHISKPAPTNSLWDPILKKTHHKKGLAEWLKWEHLPSKCETLGSKKKEDIWDDVYIESWKVFAQKHRTSCFGSVMQNKNKVLWLGLLRYIF